MYKIRVYDYDLHKVRVINLDGEPWFAAADVCEILGYRSPADLVRRMDDDEYQVLPPREFYPLADEMVWDNRISGGIVLNEKGLGSAIRWSLGYDASTFGRWINRVVLPSIFKPAAEGDAA